MRIGSFWRKADLRTSTYMGANAEYNLDTPVGRLHHLAPVVRLSETPPRWARPSVPLGYNEPAWPPR